MSRGEVGEEGNDLCTKSSSAILAILCYGRRAIVILLEILYSPKAFFFHGKLKGRLSLSYKIFFPQSS